MNYVGSELELFRHAVRWKKYWSSQILQYVNGRILDVGCGIGASADHLWSERASSYTFLEPDEQLLAQVPKNVGESVMSYSELIAGTTADLHGRAFDSILYIDVLEHLSDPKEELQRALELLAPKGHLIILVPAFQFLYSPFDKAIGHYRRYDRPSLHAHLPSGATIVKERYLDSVGMLLSLGNKLLLRRAAPTTAQIQFWDSRIVPLSRFFDPLIGHAFGRSLVVVLRKD